MSLAVLANDIASKGRGEDSMLVHMTPGEVHGLQALALAHGGSLTINPDTGLPEAGFLKSLLPMLAGVFLGPAGLGLMSAMQAGLAVGAVTGLATGSLKQGIMAGLGAYGGSGLGESISALGAAAPEAAAQAIGSTAAGPGSQAAMLAEQTAGFGQAGLDSLAKAASTASPFTQQGAMLAEQMAGFGPEAGQLLNQAATTSSPISALPQTATPMPTPPTPPTPTAPSPFDTFQRGVGEAIKDPSKVLTKDNLKYGFAAAAPMMMATPELPGQDEDDDAMIRPYRFDPIGGQYTRGTPYPAKQANTRFGFDGGGIVALAEGGTGTRDEAAYARAYANRYGRGAAAPAPAAPEGPITNMPVELNPVRAPNDLSQLGDIASGTRNYLERNPDVLNAYFQNNYGMDPNQFVQTHFNRYGRDEMRAAPVDVPNQSPNEQQFNRLTGGSSDAYNYLMGRGAYPTMPRVPGGGPIMRPYSELMGVPQDPTKQKFIWDQQQRKYIPNPEYKAPVDPGAETADADVPSTPTDNPAYVYGWDGGGGFAAGGLPALARGGMESHLGDYSDGGRLLRGPGDGVSDSIPATIANKRPARLADGEFVVPARIVSELGNGSTEAGARKLYAMMDRVQKNRRKSVGRGKVAVDSNSDKYLPA